VLVDYAHTPAALETVLGEARSLVAGGPGGPPGRVVLVFGCGGERDRAKRPLMGEAAARLADVVVVTSDNPRSEDPGRIIDEVLAGVPGAQRADESGPVLVEPDRARAIGLAVDLARPGDVVLLAGKGHETTQQLAGSALPFDDRAVAAAALAGRAGGAPQPAERS
jgi:UDP-N-acetylmuramoyl-L-alanyl-D-glutamate--2,6-diaminopimelate ligase